MSHVASPRAPRAVAASIALLLTGGAAGCHRQAVSASPAVVLGPANGPLKLVPAPTGPDISVADLKSRLYAFSDDSMLGREAGGPGNVKATDYIASEVRRLGLEPAGEDGGYFQVIPMVTRPLDSAATRLTIAGDAGPAPELWRDWAPLPPTASMPFSGSNALEGAQVVYGGRADDPSLISVEAARGKVVLLAPARDATGGIVSRWWEYPALSRLSGAAAVAIAQLDLQPGTALAVSMRVRGGLEDPAHPSVTPRPAGFYVTRALAERLLGKPLDGARPGDAGRTVHGAVAYRDVPAAYPARNVVAILRGSDPALNREYVAVGAHSDHLGFATKAVDHDSLHAWLEVYRPIGANGDALADTPARRARFQRMLDSVRRVRPPRRDSIYNGADDDGSGSVTVLEIAENLAAAPTRPRRSILFVWHTAEEKGLYGSEWFTTHPTVPRDSIVAQLNMDMVGRGDYYAHTGNGRPHLQVIGANRLSTQLGALVDSVNAAEAVPMGIDYSFNAPGHPLNRYCRSDHYNYARWGIPIAFISLGYGTDYHELSDEAQYIRYDHTAVVGRFVRDLALSAANRPARLVVDQPKPDPNGSCRQ